MRRALVACILVIAPAGLRGQEKAPTTRGAVLGGAIGAGAAGALGALIGQGVCDKADCGGAWIDGLVPGVVLGGLAGAALGAGLGLLLSGDGPASPAEPAPWQLAGRVRLDLARATSEFENQTVIGPAAAIGLRRRGLWIGPEVAFLRRGEWRAQSVMVAVRLEPVTGSVRPFGQVGLGRFDWRHPAVLVDHCLPGTPPQCTYRMGTLEDDYWGVGMAVGATLRAGRRGWAGFAEVRFHHAGDRPGGVGTSARQLRAVALGIERAF